MCDELRDRYLSVFPFTVQLIIGGPGHSYGADSGLHLQRQRSVSTSEFSSQVSNSERSGSVDAEQVERAKREIQGLVHEIAELSRTGVSPAEFYDAMLNKVVSALAAPGGAVWTTADTGGLQLAYQINLQQTGLVENPVGQQQHGRLLRQVMLGSEGALVAPHSGAGDATDSDEEAAANPTEFLLVLAPMRNDQGPQGVLEIFQRPVRESPRSAATSAFCCRCANSLPTS